MTGREQKREKQSEITEGKVGKKAERKPIFRSQFMLPGL
jgi:hypothetical protein